MAQMNPIANAGRQSVSHGPDGKQYINIMALPNDIQGHMSAFDVDGDGKIEVTELASLARSHQQTTATGLLFKKLTFALGTLMVILILASFGLSFAVYELTRDTIVEDHILKSIDHETVQTANADFKVDQDTLVNRATDMPLRTGDSKVAAPVELITSGSPDSFFMELYHLHITSPAGDSVIFKVNSVARSMNGQTEMAKSTVTLFTDLGKVNLTGNVLAFDEQTGAVLDSVMIPTSQGENGRKLLFFGDFTGSIIGASVGAAACIAITGGICALAYGGAVVGVGVHAAVAGR
mmetsp:Transcript_575/g.681  ORF Transcript_575/g.681 Transcript_575/m.681 type:complete len:293 (-) Transcript_575:137-1015(-)|eukprot:CAMPEP_0197848430 /NCGR_PEP_ID=MMETSP1438-20131217/8706_1 /TAXON_ID=1461541 /ORGANISM="Pterosperma sp., Strain CCMP1384" /LENGTH=292 /DNA_ID=CAMNT_0043460671 /DNA_START=70 /DNA_END=948 /DNA_ORIENTATION=+